MKTLLVTQAELTKDKASHDGEDYASQSLLPLLEHNRDAVRDAPEVEDIGECHFLLWFLWLANKESSVEKSKKNTTSRDTHHPKKPRELRDENSYMKGTF